MWVWKDSHTFLFLTIIIIKPLFLALKNIILTMLNAGHTAHSIAFITGFHALTIFRLYSKECFGLYKVIWWLVKKLSLFFKAKERIFIIIMVKNKDMCEFFQTQTWYLNVYSCLYNQTKLLSLSFTPILYFMKIA